MSMQKRKFTKEQKLEILEEASLQGVQATLDKHGLYPTTFYSWKKKFETMGEAGFRHGMTPEHIKEIKRLESGTDGCRNQSPSILLPTQLQTSRQKANGNSD